MVTAAGVRCRYSRSPWRLKKKKKKVPPPQHHGGRARRYLLSLQRLVGIHCSAPFRLFFFPFPILSSFPLRLKRINRRPKLFALYIVLFFFFHSTFVFRPPYISTQFYFFLIFREDIYKRDWSEIEDFYKKETTTFSPLPDNFSRVMIVRGKIERDGKGRKERGKVKER